MFCPVLKFVRLALCALALALLGAGGHALRTEATTVRETPEWNAEERAKLVLAVATRAGAACPLAGAMQVSGMRVPAPGAAVVFCAAASLTGGPAAGWRARAPERQPGWRATPGVVRLLI